MLESLKSYLNAQPFEPFIVRTSVRREYPVSHPELVLLTKSAVHVGIGEVEDHVPENARMISLLHITAVEPASEADAAVRSK